MFTLTIEDKHGGVADEYSFVDGEFLIGRSHGADIILPSDNVSRRHARLYTVDGRCYLEDLGSANGVFVNGRRINDVHEIEGSVQLRVGDYYLHIRAETEAQAEPKVFCKLRGQNLSVADEVFRLTRRVNLVGRGKDCTVTVIDPSVSRIHGKLSAERGGVVTVEDLKSSNGTFVNNERVETAEISHLDLLRFGNVEFIVEFPDLTASDGERVPDVALHGIHDVPESRPNNTLLWIAIGLLSAVLVLGSGALYMLYPTLSGQKAKDEAIAQAEASAEQTRLQAEAEQKRLDALVGEAQAHEKENRWDEALLVWEKVKLLDPAHEGAARAINRLKGIKRDRVNLDDGRAAFKAKRYGEAAKLFRRIAKTSPYFLPSQSELNELNETKDSLLIQARTLLNRRANCDELSEVTWLLDQIQRIDANDPKLAEMVAQSNTLRRKKRCDKD